LASEQIEIIEEIATIVGVSLTFGARKPQVAQPHIIDKAIQSIHNWEVDLTPLKPTTFRLESELLDGLQQVKERDGVAITEQVRRAVMAWLDSKGVKVKAGRKRGQTRKQP
jgi:hypothetical protein